MDQVNRKDLLSQVFQVAMGRKAGTKKQSPGYLTETAWKCYCYGNKDGEDCYGYEELPVESYESIKWSNNFKDNKLLSSGSVDIPNEYECLIRYYKYIANYDLPLVADYEMSNTNQIAVSNKVEKFKSIRILGRQYNAADKNKNGGYYCAYQLDDQGEKQLRPCQILFFFAHCLQYQLPDGSNHSTTHYLAFARWFKYSTPNTTLSEFSSGNTLCWRNSFEDTSDYSILPVQKLNSGVTIRLDYLTNINIVTFLPRKIH